MKVVARTERTIPPRRLILAVCGFVTILAIVVALIPAVVFAGNRATTSDNDFATCYADGSLHVQLPNNYDYRANDTFALQAWRPGLFLSITLGFGTFTFPQAKALDVAFDLLAGRGGQALLVLWTYPLFRRLLFMYMEERPMSLRLFNSMAFQRISLEGLWALCSLEKHPSRESKSLRRAIDKASLQTLASYAGLIYIFGYLLAFPTVVSIMSGYQTGFVPYVQDPVDTNNLVRFSALELPYAVINDGERVGLTPNYPVGADTLSSIDLNTIVGYAANLTGIQYFFAEVFCQYSYNRNETAWSGGMPTVLAAHTDTWKFVLPGFDGVKDYCTSGWGANTTVVPYSSPTTWSNITLNGTSYVLPTAPLSIEYTGRAYGQGWQSYWPNTTLANEWYWKAMPPPFDPAGYYIENNEHDRVTSTHLGLPYLGKTLLNTTWMAETGVCQATSTYKWGFSAEMLLFFVVATLLYVNILFSLRWSVYHCSRLDRYDQPASTYRDAIDLVAELRSQIGPEVDDMSAEQIEKLVDQRRMFVNLDTEGLLEPRRRIRTSRDGYAKVLPEGKLTAVQLYMLGKKANAGDAMNVNAQAGSVRSDRTDVAENTYDSTALEERTSLRLDHDLHEARHTW